MQILQFPDSSWGLTVLKKIFFRFIGLKGLKMVWKKSSLIWNFFSLILAEKSLFSLISLTGKSLQNFPWIPWFPWLVGTLCWTKQHHPVSKISNWPENPKNLTTGCSEFHLYQTYVFADRKFGIRISHLPKGVNVNTNYDGIKLAVRSISHSGHTSDSIVSASIVPSCANQQSISMHKKNAENVPKF